MSLLPARCTAGLVLAAEPIASWPDDCDLSVFLSDLYDHELVVRSPDGTTSSSNIRWQGVSLYAPAKARYIAKALEFGSIANESRFVTLAGQGTPDAIPVFERDATFGHMAKYSIALDAVVTALLEDDAFFSIAHTLEILSELECSVLLASRLYYKHALQVLRGFLELSVMHLDFAKRPDSYARWEKRDPGFRVPPLRSSRERRGLLEQLDLDGVIPRDLRTTAERLYGQLNGAIHSNEGRLINRGASRDTWVGLQFKRDQYQDWCRFFVQVVQVGIRLLTHTVTLKLSTQKPAG